MFSLDEKPSTSEDAWSTTPYPEGAVFDKRDQSRKVPRPAKDPRETTIVLFPVRQILFL